MNLAPAVRHGCARQGFPVRLDRAPKREEGAHQQLLCACECSVDGQNLRGDEAGTGISAPFFDVEDEFHVKVDLWLTASISIELMGLLYEVTRGRDVVKFIPNFESNLQRIHQANEALVSDMKSTDRYKRAFEMSRRLSHDC